MKRKTYGGITSVSLPVFATNSSTGAGMAVAYNAAGITAEYRRQGEAAWTPFTLVSATLGTWLSAGWAADGALAGAYELSPPDAAFVAGARWVEIRVYGVTNLKPILIECELDAVNYQDAAGFGLTRLDATVSSRSTYAGSDTAGTTTLLSRLTSTRAGNMDYLDAAVSSRLASGNVTIGAYAAGQDPAAKLTASGYEATVATSVAGAVLVTAANKLATDVSGHVALTPAGVDLIPIETGVNLRQAFSPILAAAAGRLSGATSGASSIVIKAGNDPSTTRIAADTDSNGNRTSVVLTLPT